MKTLKDKILKLIKERPHCSFAELSNLEGFCGKMALVSQENPNIVLWPWCSEEAIAAFKSLHETKSIIPHPASVLIYFCDGKMPTMKLGKRASASIPKTPKWFPITFTAR